MTLNLTIPQTHHTDFTPRITVIGVGGGGTNAVDNMIAMNLQGVEFVVANTDAQQLMHSRADRRVQLGPHITQGLGAGAKPEVGRAAAEEAADEIVPPPRRRAHGVHHRRHGRRHRHRRGPGDRPHGAREEHFDCWRRDQAVHLRGHAPRPLRRGRHRGAAAVRRHADRDPEPEPVPPCQRAHRLERGVQDGGRGALHGRPRRHRPDDGAGPREPRLRRHPHRDGGDGQGNDGHGRSGGREPGDPRGRARDQQPAARRQQHGRCARPADQHHRRRGHDAVRGGSGRQPHPRGSGRGSQHHLRLGDRRSR